MIIGECFALYPTNNDVEIESPLYASNTAAIQHLLTP